MACSFSGEDAKRIQDVRPQGGLVCELNPLGANRLATSGSEKVEAANRAVVVSVPAKVVKKGQRVDRAALINATQKVCVAKAGRHVREQRSCRGQGIHDRTFIACELPRGHKEGSLLPEEGSAKGCVPDRSVQIRLGLGKRVAGIKYRVSPIEDETTVEQFSRAHLCRNLNPATAG